MNKIKKSDITNDLFSNAKLSSCVSVDLLNKLKEEDNLYSKLYDIFTKTKDKKIKELDKEYFDQYHRLVDKYSLMNTFHINKEDRKDIINKVWGKKCELCNQVLELELLELAHIIKREHKDHPKIGGFVDHPVNVFIFCPTCHRRVDKNLLKDEHIEKLKKQWKKHEMKFNEGCDELINLYKTFDLKIERLMKG